MEHSLPQVSSPWRTATLVASAVAALELVILAVLGVMLLADPVSRHVQNAAEAKVFAPVAKPRPAAAVGEPTLSRAETLVTVLNGSGRAGAAAATAATVRSLGYSIGNVGNAPGTGYMRTIVMYRPGHRPEAARLAADLKLKIVGPLDGMKPADLLGAHVALVIGS